MLDATQILAYVTALGIAAAIPGPGMTALVARSIGSGARAGFAMLAGIVLGDLLYLSCAVFGLAMIAQHAAPLFFAIKWASIAYLSWLAWQFWHADHHAIDAENVHREPGALWGATLSGLAITLGNPKTIAFYLALLPVVIDLSTVSLQSWAFLLVPLTVAVLAAVGALFVLAALSVRRQLSSARAQRLIHRGAAGAMLAAAGTMAARS